MTTRRRLHRPVATIALCAVLALGLAGCGGGGGGGGGGDTGTTPPVGDATAGEAVFAANCSACHSAVAGESSPNPAAPNLAELAPDEARVLRQVKNGGAQMPAGLVSGQDAADVAAYVTSL